VKLLSASPSPKIYICAATLLPLAFAYLQLCPFLLLVSTGGGPEKREEALFRSAATSDVPDG